METEDIVWFSVMIGSGVVAYIMVILEGLIRKIFLKEPMELDISGMICCFFFFICPPFSIIIFVCVSIRELNYIFKFYKFDD